MPLSGFHPAIQQWFTQSFDEPTEPQREGWPHIRGGRNALIAAPIGADKGFRGCLLLSALSPLLIGCQSAATVPWYTNAIARGDIEYVGMDDYGIRIATSQADSCGWEAEYVEFQRAVERLIADWPWDMRIQWHRFACQNSGNVDFIIAVHGTRPAEWWRIFTTLAPDGRSTDRLLRIINYPDDGQMEECLTASRAILSRSAPWESVSTFQFHPSVDLWRLELSGSSRRLATMSVPFPGDPESGDYQLSQLLQSLWSVAAPEDPLWEYIAPGP